MQHAEALGIAERVVAQLAPHCSRIEIAGSIRRGKPQVKDIEVVAIPLPYENNGMFVSGIAEVVNDWQKVKGELGPQCRYTQRLLPEGIKLDLFFATPDNWGWIFALRTGSSEFNFKYLEAMKARGMRAADGNILNQFLTPIPIREERELFDLIGMKFVPPEKRI